MNPAVRNHQDSSGSDDLERTLESLLEGRSSCHPMPIPENMVNYKAASISRLPDETLLNIFFLLMRFRRDEIFRPRWHGETPPWDWTTLTKVCSTWRKLALEYRTLWSDIVKITDLTRIRVFLERSGRTELYVDLCPIDSIYHDQNLSALFNLLKDHMWRVREFRMQFEDGEFPLDDYVMCLTAASEHIKVLDIDHYVDYFSDFPASERIPDFSKINPAIHLNVFSVCGVRMDWKSSLMVGLSELGLFSLPLEGNPPLTSLLDILEQSPMLRILRLNDIQVEHDDLWSIGNPRTNDRVTNLPQLQSVSLSEIPSHILFALLKCIKIPRKASLEISCQMSDSGSHDFSFLQERKACHSIHICMGREKHTIFADPFPDDWGLASNTTLSFATPSPEKFVVAQEILLGNSFWQSAKIIGISFSERYEAFRKYSVNESDIEWDDIFDGLPNDIEELSVGIPLDDPNFDDYIDLLLQTLSKRNSLVTGRSCPQLEDTSNADADKESRVFTKLKSITIYGEEPYSHSNGPMHKEVLKRIDLGHPIQCANAPLS